MRRFGVWGAVLAAGILGCGPVGPDAPGVVEQQIAAAAAEVGVPASVLEAHAWSVSHFVHVQPDEHLHATSIHGVMGLVEGSTLEEAAALLDVEPAQLMTDRDLNIRAGAALFAKYYDEEKDLARAVGRMSGSDDPQVQWQHAVQVVRVQRSGVATWRQGKELPVRYRSPAAGGLMEAVLDAVGLPPVVHYGDAEYPLAYWVPADPSNYTASNRPTSYSIDTIVIHTVQGSYAGAISWFQNPAANVSAQYVVRSSDGEVTQMLHDKDWGWHAGNSTVNRHSIGIEHEGFVDDPTWYTDAMYESSAALTRYYVDQYGIPLDRDHIIGHVEVPGATHSDPGPNWDWDYYMSLIAQDSAHAKLVGFVREDDIHTGAAIAGAQVELSTGDVVTTDADGYYQFTNLEAGSYDVTVSADGFETASDSKEVTDGIGTFWKSVALSEAATTSTGPEDIIDELGTLRSSDPADAQPGTGCAVAGPSRRATQPAGLALILLLALGCAASRRRRLPG